MQLNLIKYSVAKVHQKMLIFFVGSFSLLRSQLFQPTIMLCQGRQLGVITKRSDTRMEMFSDSFLIFLTFQYSVSWKSLDLVFFGALIV